MLPDDSISKLEAKHPPYTMMLVMGWYGSVDGVRGSHLLYIGHTGAMLLPSGVGVRI